MLLALAAVLTRPNTSDKVVLCFIDFCIILSFSMLLGATSRITENVTQLACKVSHLDRF